MKVRHVCWPVTAALILFGCGKPQQPPSSQAPVQSGVADAPVLSPGDATALGVGAPQTEGDKAWAEIEKSLEALIRPPENMPAEPTKEQRAELQRAQGEKMEAAATRVREFYTKYSEHARAPEARQHEQGLLSVAARLGNTNGLERLAAIEKARLDDPNLPEDERLQLRVEQIQRAASIKAGGDMEVVLTEMEKGVRTLQKEFPKRSELGGLILQLAEARLNRGELETARKMAQEILDGKPEAELKAGADELLVQIGRVGKPLDIKFKALDGREIDLTGMKGKVVLVDFWATWCAPCIQDLPNVKSAYDKLNPKGFEIVGISFDRDLEKLKQVVGREKMAWPQFFDESGDGNKYAEEFGINRIPTMWLVDKKGVLRELNAREDLVAKVERLLAEN